MDFYYRLAALVPVAASGEYRVDEVTRNPHPSEEVSGRREAPQGHADRGHDRRFRAHGGRSRARDQVEQDRADIHDPSHFAYPTYAKAAIQRRENLKHSADELKVQLNDAKDALAEAFEELKKVELLDERDRMRERPAEAAIEQAELDAIGLMRAQGAR